MNLSRWILALALSVPLIGCNKPRESQTPTQPPASRPAAQGSGWIIGKIVFPGAAPAPKIVCEAGHYPGSKAVFDETIVVNPNGTLRNVIVYLRDAPSADPSSNPVILDQVNCQYVPHVLAIGVGQPLIVRNSDHQPHNVHLSCQVNSEVNFAMVDRGDHPPLTFKAPEFFTAGCDVHSWMRAQIGVFDHPYFAVTGDDGTFKIDNVPPGTYTLVARHELFGEITQSVTVADKQSAIVTLTYSDKQ